MFVNFHSGHLRFGPEDISDFKVTDYKQMKIQPLGNSVLLF